jgi:hypothetical protein
MKWKLPKIGDVRIVNKFLWKPLEINGEKRWFEKVKIQQIFTKEIFEPSNKYLKDDPEARFSPHSFYIHGEFRWIDVKFIDSVIQDGEIYNNEMASTKIKK